LIKKRKKRQLPADRSFHDRLVLILWILTQ